MKYILSLSIFFISIIIWNLNKDINNIIKTLKVDGGATKNNFLMQFQANLSNINIEKPENIESTALGAALLSGIGSNYWSNLENLSKKREIDKNYLPELKKEYREQLLKKWSKAIKQCLA